MSIEEELAMLPDAQHERLEELEQLAAASAVFAPHQHFWQFQLNANHTLVRGCIHCGQADATLVMGNVHDLVWHRIQEPSD